MAKPIVTEEHVFTVANELQAVGTEPTILTVQERIGGGSHTTIKCVLECTVRRGASWSAATVRSMPRTYVYMR